MLADAMRVLAGFCLLIAYAAAAETEGSSKHLLKTTTPKAESERLLSEATEEAPVKYVEQHDTKQEQRENEEIYTKPARRQSLLAEDYDELQNVKYAEDKQVPQSYKFGFEVKDHKEGHQFRHEEKDAAGNVQGRFGYRDGKGQYRQVEYIADVFGFRANVKTNEAGVANEDPADVGIQKSQDLTFHTQAAAPGTGYLAGDGIIYKDESRNKVNLQSPQTVVNDEPHSEETRYGLKHIPQPRHHFSPETNLSYLPSTNEPDEEYHYAKDNKPVRPKNASPAVVYRHFFKKHLPRRENIVPVHNYPNDYRGTTSNHQIQNRPYEKQPENLSPSTYQYQTNNEDYSHENEDYHYENEKRPQIVYQQYQHESHPQTEIDGIRGNPNEDEDGKEIKYEAPVLADPEFYEIYKNSADNIDPSYPKEKRKLIFLQDDKVKHDIGLHQQDDKQNVPYPGQVAIFVKHKNEEEPTYGQRQYGFYTNSNPINGNKESNILGYNNRPPQNQIGYGMRYISRDVSPVQILQKVVHQPETQLHYTSKADAYSRPVHKPVSNKRTELHTVIKPHNAKSHNEKIESYPKNLPLSILQESNTEARKQNQEQFSVQQAILEIDADVYKQLIENKAQGQRIIAIPYNSLRGNYGDHASSVPIIFNKNVSPLTSLKPHGILHLPLKNAELEYTEQQQKVVFPLDNFKRPAAIILHIAHGQNIVFMSPKGPSKEDISEGKEHLIYKLSQPHVDTFQKSVKERARNRDYSKSKWIPITPLWNQIRRQSKQDRTSPAIANAEKDQNVSKLPRTDSSIYQFSTKSSDKFNARGGQSVF